MNTFGGDWTISKIDIVVDYTKAYLQIMKAYNFKIMYFDGFAGSGDIFREDHADIDVIKGAALRISEIDNPISFDMYYFVEKQKKAKEELELALKKHSPDKQHYVVLDDCNSKLFALADFLRKNKNYRVLAFIDPYGMAVNWSSIEILKGLGVDLWILVPTGIGVNRLLKKDFNISEPWLLKLETFLGLPRNEIISHFYKKQTNYTLFGEESLVVKESNAIDRAGELYKIRLETIFKYVSEAYALRNSSGSIMYHFMMASNNKNAKKIANDVIKKYL